MAKKSPFLCEILFFLVGMPKKILVFNKNIDFCIKDDIFPPKNGKGAFFMKNNFFYLTVTCFAKISKTYSRKSKKSFFGHIVLSLLTISCYVYQIKDLFCL